MKTPKVERIADPVPFTNYHYSTGSVVEEMVLIGMSRIWTGPPKKGDKCRSCGDAPRQNHYCLECDRWGGKPGVVRLPGLPVGKYPNPEYSEQ